MTATFHQFVSRARKSPPIVGRILAFDPGETTGVACFISSAHHTELILGTEISTYPVSHGTTNIGHLFSVFKPTHVVFETYRIYKWKTDDHAWNEVHPVKVIGLIEHICAQHGIVPVGQTAQIAKQFCTDEKLEQWGLYTKGLKHCRDAMRHATYMMLFQSA